MRINAGSNRASIKPGPLIALAAVAVGVAIYYWKFTPIERQLSARIVQFEVTSESDEARTPPTREALFATVTFANDGDEIETISATWFRRTAVLRSQTIGSSSSSFRGNRNPTEISKRAVRILIAGRSATA